MEDSEREGRASSAIEPSSPIGIFDSGIGGLSVLNEIRRLLPQENIIYYSDSKYAPYGNRGLDYVRSRVDYISELLYSYGIKAMVVACNTATSVSCHILRSRYDISIIGMEPALKLAVDRGKKKIAVVATTTTLKEKKFENLLSRVGNASLVYKFPAPTLVKEIEGRYYTRESIFSALDEAFSGMGSEDFDAVVLGCTHFVLVKSLIQEYFPHLPLFDGNSGTVLNLKNILSAKGLLNDKGESAKIMANIKNAVIIDDKVALMDSNDDNARSLVNYVER